MKGDIYHILNRGVEKRIIFVDDQDYFRFRDDLKDFNDKDRVPMSHYKRNNKSKSDVVYPLDVRHPTEELVDVLCVCLMPNHFHLLVREKVNGGAGLFSKKIGVGYTHYFNQKNKRSGVLFQGRTKKILIKKDKHFIHLPYYILTNPIKLFTEVEKNDGQVRCAVRLKKIKIEFLDKYKWVSFRDIVSSNEKGIFSEIINKKLFLEIFGFKSDKEFREKIIEWII